MPHTINNPVANRRRPRSAPAPQHDGPPVEDLRLRVVAERVRSPALAAVIAGLAYAVPENLRGAR